METWRPEEIGATAGKVWNFLHSRGESSLKRGRTRSGRAETAGMHGRWLACAGRESCATAGKTLVATVSDRRRAQNSRMQ